MGLKASLLHIPSTQAGFNYNRNFELVADTALIDPSTNFNLHNLGIEKRGGSSIIMTRLVTSRGLGGFDFRQSTGAQHMVYAKSGNVFANDDSNDIAFGMSLSNIFHFNQLYDDLYICDGASIPRVWTGVGLATDVIPASDWSLTGYPFQMIFHPRGASFRNWAITRNGVYASNPDDPSDFADASVIYIPVYSKSGLIGAVEFGNELFVFSKTETFRIEDSSATPGEWGYQKAIWEGGAAHWRLIVHADNNVYVMTDDLTIYSLSGVFETGDYRRASLSRPAQIDRYLRETGAYQNIENWHASYDPKLRAIKWFVQIGGSSNNTALVQFIDREPEKMWALHNNLTYNSGYRASCSFTYRKSVGDWRVRTIDYSGNIWELEQAIRNDNGNPITSVLKWKPWEYENPVMHKHFPKNVIRARSSTNMNFSIAIWINNMRIPDINISISSTGAQFNISTFDNAYFAADAIAKTPFDVKSYGEVLQMQITHSTLNEDFFLSEVISAFKENGLRLYE